MHYLVPVLGPRRARRARARASSGQVETRGRPPKKINSRTSGKTGSAAAAAARRGVVVRQVVSAHLPPPKLDRNVYDGGAAVSSWLRLASQDGVREQVRLALTEAVRGVREGKRGCGAAARSQHRERHDARCEREPHAPGRPAAAPPRQTDRGRQSGAQPQPRAPVEVWRPATHTHAATRRPPPSAGASRRPACVHLAGEH